jgi:hypothetical protein
LPNVAKPPGLPVAGLITSFLASIERLASSE